MKPSPYNCSQEHYLSSMLTLTGAERIIKDLIRFMKNESVPQLPSVPLTNKRDQESKAMYETHF